MEDPANKFLQAAMGNLAQYIAETQCSWCIGKTQQVVAMLRELMKVGPQAKQLSKSIDKLQAGNIRGALQDLRQMTGTETPGVTPSSPLIPLANLKDISSPAPMDPPAPAAPFTGKFKPRVFGSIIEGQDAPRLFNRDQNERRRPLKRLRERRQED